MPIADLIVDNAAVYTVNHSSPNAEAVAVTGNTIAFVGLNEDAADWRGPNTRVIDGQGHTLMPGFIDSHFHLLHGSLALNDIQLYDVANLDQLAATVRDFVEQHPDRDWYLGYGLSYDTLPNQQQLTRHHLDAIEANKPLILFAFDFHTAWANTEALRQLGWLVDAPADVSKGVLLDNDGFASGVLLELNIQILDALPQPTFDQKRAALNKGLAQAAGLGITSVHNMDGNPELIALFAAMEDLGELTLRVYCPYDVTPKTTPEQFVDALAMRDNYQSSLLRGGCVKFFMDGVIESGTGFVLRHYPNEPDNFGDPLYSAKHFTQMATEADRLGLQIFVHAVGDAAVRRALDGFEAVQQSNGHRDSRHRIEHIELIHPDDLPRFAELGVIASMQPLHAPLNPEKNPDAWSAHTYPEQWNGCFPWRGLRNAGAHLIFGSDWPIVSQSPFEGLDIAVNRGPIHPDHQDERQTLAEAIAAYTCDAAYAEFQEQKKGQLKPGMWADMVLVSENIFAIPADEIAHVQPVVTVCDGQVVFEG